MKKIALALVAGTLSSLAVAAPLSGQQILEQFNLVTLGNADSTNGGTQQHVDGRSYIGGSVSGGDYAQHPQDITASSYAGLTVAGSANNVRVNGNGAVILGNFTNSTVNTGPAYVAGSISGAGHLNGGTLAPNSSAVVAAVAAKANGDFSSALNGLSLSLKQLKDTHSRAVSSDPYYPTTTFYAAANDQHMAVFNLTASSLSTTKKFMFDYGSATTVIINVSGLDVDIGASFDKLNGTNNDAFKAATNTIWNFYEATDISITSQFGGTILAPLAHLTNGGPYNNANIEGSVLVGSLTQNAEIHSNNFKGDISSVVTAVPEPESYALMLGGLALMTLVARRRRA